MPLDKRDEPLQVGTSDRAAGRVVRVGDADEARVVAQSRSELVEVELPTLLEPELKRLDDGADRARRLEVRRVVRGADQRMRARLEQRRGDDEERRGRASGDEDVVEGEVLELAGDQRPEALRAEMIAVGE